MQRECLPVRATVDEFEQDGRRGGRADGSRQEQHPTCDGFAIFGMADIGDAAVPRIDAAQKLIGADEHQCLAGTGISSDVRPERRLAGLPQW